MICISINQESRRLAVVDMFNAAKQCDLLEVRVDRFGMAPELGELLSVKPKPVIMSCRRQAEGGHWDGSEAERLALLRQCIVSKADYVEIELDAADKIKRFPPSQRVISYTVKPEDTAADIAERYAEAQTKTPDVIKLTTYARTPEEAWPLVQILGNPRVPTVVVGLGKPGVMLAVLGKKIGAPWTYAALERGMEAYPGQPTIHDLNTVYHYRSIDRSTRLIGVTGFGERAYVSVAVLNAVLAHLGLAVRCLPVGVGDLHLFRKVVEAVKLAAVVVAEEHQADLLEMAGDTHPSAEQARAVDLLVHQANAWYGFHTLCQAAVTALLATLPGQSASDAPLRNRVAVLVGVNASARTLAVELQKHGAGVILASHQKKAAQQLAHDVGCRYIQFEALYTTVHDVLVVCADEPKAGQTEAKGVHPGYLKAAMTVLDLTAGVRRTTLLREAQARGCGVVEPRRLLLDQLELQAKLLTGKQVPRQVLEEAVPAIFAEDE